MHKRQITMIIGIMAVAAMIAIFAIVFNSTPHEEAATAATSSQSSKAVNKKQQSNSQGKAVSKASTTVDKSSSSTGTEKNLNVKNILKGQNNVPAIVAVNQDNGELAVVFADDGTQSLDDFMKAYAKATGLVLKAASQQSKISSVMIARQVKLEDGLEYAVAGKWQKNQLTTVNKLATEPAIKDVLLSASHYSIGGAVWDAFSQPQKNEYQNHQQGGQVESTDDGFNKWVQAGIEKNK